MPRTALVIATIALALCPAAQAQQQGGVMGYKVFNATPGDLSISAVRRCGALTEAMWSGALRDLPAGNARDILPGKGCAVELRVYDARRKLGGAVLTAPDLYSLCPKASRVRVQRGECQA